MQYKAGFQSFSWMIATARFLLLVSIFFALFPGPAGAIGTRSIQFGAPVADDYTVLLTDDVADLLQQSNASAVRLNFKNPWGTDTSAFYAAYDAIVDRLRVRGITIIGLLSNEFLAGNQQQWQENAWEVTGGNGHNNYIDAFGYQAARVAQRYEGKVQYWEVWNEPNCWSSSFAVGCTYIYPSNFAALLSHVFTQLRYYNSFQVEVVSGGLLGHDLGGTTSANAGADYLGETYARGKAYGSWNWVYQNAGQYPLDHIGQHIYIQQGTTVSSSYLQSYLSWVRNAYVAYEGGATPKKTFLTEIGWRTDAVLEALQNTNLSITYSVMESTSYVGTTTWFFLRDQVNWSEQWGLVRSDNTAKPAWTTFGGGTIGPCGSTCSQCILGERPDVLSSYGTWGWDTSCSGRDAIVDDWCINLDPTACNNLKANECSASCDVTPPSTPIAVENSGFESNASSQFGPLDDWGPSGAWAYHSGFPAGNNGSLGTKFGYYSAGTSETIGQVLSERFEAGTTYNFKSFAIGGGNRVGLIPYQIGYANMDGDLSSFVHLATNVIDVTGNNSWTETTGVTYTSGASGSELGKQIIIRFGGSAAGGSSDVWLDEVSVTRSGTVTPLSVTNADIESNSTGQFGAIDSWGPNGGWALHSGFPAGNNGGLGSSFGFYSAGTSETVGQVLSERFAVDRAYTFKSFAIGGGNRLGTVPYQIGYAAIDNNLSSFVALATATINLDGNSSWTETTGVTHMTGASGAEIGKQVIVRFGNSAAGGSSDIWFDGITVTRE